jgi:hypothetical protein
VGKVIWSGKSNTFPTGGRIGHFAFSNQWENMYIVR